IRHVSSRLENSTEIPQIITSEHQNPYIHDAYRSGFENQKELTKMQLDNQKEIAKMQNETQKEIAGIQSATSRQNTKDQVYAQNEMLAYQQKESRSEERFSRNAETDLVCRLLLEKKKEKNRARLPGKANET